jgi:hypothetical protein
MATHVVELTITDEELAKMIPNLYHTTPKPVGVDDITHIKSILFEVFEDHYKLCVRNKARHDSKKSLDTSMIKAIKNRNLNTGV